MTINEAIKVLEDMKKDYGNCKLYFDCPICKQSFTPAILITKAIHLKEE